MASFDSLQPLGNRPTSAVIADQIRERIMDGTLAAGTQLSEALLAERLGVSRGPVREALQRLIAQGVIEGHRGRGAFVVTLEPDDIVDVYRCRSVTERAAVSLLLDQGDPTTNDEVRAAVAGLREAVDGMDEAAAEGDWTRVMEMDFAFHERLVAASGSKRLARMFATLLVETRMCLVRLEQAYPRPADIVPQHREMVTAIEEGDAARALDLVEAHMRQAVALQLGDAVALDAALGA